MEQPEVLPREPSLNELCLLSGFANIAYAVRCGRRVQPKFQPAHPDAAQTAKIVESSLRWSEMSLQQEMPVDDSVKALVDAACAVAEASSDTNDFAAYAAFHAVRGAVLVAETPEPFATDVFLEIVATSFGASRVLLANMPPWVNAQALSALRADYDKLVQLALGNGAERGKRVDPSSAGPLGNLWPDKAPTW